MSSVGQALLRIPRTPALHFAYIRFSMTPRETISLSQVAELLAHNGYDVAEVAPGVLRVRDLHTGIGYQAALEGNVLYQTVNLTTVPDSEITPALMRKMLAAHVGISTSAFRLFEAGDGTTSITLNNYCVLQDLGPGDREDILSIANYLLADVLAARDLLQPGMVATVK